MNRRAFVRTLPALAAAGLSALHEPRAAHAAAGPHGIGGRVRQEPLVDGARLNATLARLSTFGRNADGGVDRVAFSDADLAGRAYVAELMREAGLEPSVDFAGNLVGRRAGTRGDVAPLMLGSHIDSVPGGGNYDGDVGSLAAIEVARTLNEAGIALRHPLEVVVFANEEGGKTGSRALSGEVEPRELDLVTASGRTIRDGIAFIGGDPGRLGQARREPGSIAAYLELHIEQGSVLDRRGIPIGVVEGIVGIRRWLVTVEGFANHAGTTPMDQRQDALLAAARFIDAANRVVTARPGSHVGTVGRVQAEPGAPNVIAGRAALTLELRALDMETIDALFAEIAAEAERIGQATGTRFALEPFYVSRAAPTAEPIRRVIEDAAAALGLETLRMPSGAGHDAQSIALLAPIGMIFVPSVGGISHSPQEFSRPEEITNGANVLLHSLLALDAGTGERGPGGAELSRP